MPTVWLDAVVELASAGDERPGLASLHASSRPEKAPPPDEDAPSAPPAAPPAVPSATPPGLPEDEAVKAKRMAEYDELRSWLEAKISRAQKAKETRGAEEAEKAAVLAASKARLEGLEGDAKALQADRERALKDMNVSIDHAKAKAYLLAEEGAKKAKAREEAQSLGTKEVDTLRAELSQTVANREHDDQETRLLLRMLHAERDSWQHKCQELAAQVEVQVREQAKNTILLGLLNSQLLSVRSEGKRLSAESAELTRNQRGLEAGLMTKQSQSDLLRSELRNARRAFDERKEDHTYKVQRIEQEHERIQDVADGLGKELDAQRAVLESAKGAAAVHEREQQYDLAEKRGELEKLREITGHLSTRVRELREETFTQSTLRLTECEKLEIERAGLRAREEEKNMAHFQAVSEGQSEIEILKSQHERTERERHRFEDQAEVRLAELRVQTEAMCRQTAILRTHGEASEKEGMQTVARLAAEYQALLRQQKELLAADATRDGKHVEERVSVRSEADTYAKQVTSTRDAIDTQAQAHSGRMVELHQHLQHCRVHAVTREEEMKRDLQTIRDQIEMTTRECIAQNNRLRGYERQAHKQEAHRREREIAFKAEVRALKADVKEAQGVVEGLEAKVAETHGYRIVAEENKLLEEELEEMKRTIAASNNTVATMRIEKDLLEGYKTKVLREQNAKQQKKVEELEERRKATRPLLQELIVTASKHHVAGHTVSAALRAAREMDVAVQFQPAAPPPGSGPAQRSVGSPSGITSPDASPITTPSRALA